MVAKQDDSENEHSNKRSNAAAHASQIDPKSTMFSSPSTIASGQGQKVILPVPSYLDGTENHNSPQVDPKERLWDNRAITSTDNYVGGKEYHHNSTELEEQDEVSTSTFDNDKRNIDSLFFTEQSKGKVIMPVPNNALEGRRADGWDEKIIVPTAAHGSGSTGTHLRAEQEREVKQGIQKLIMPVHYSSVNNKDLQSAVVTSQFEYGNYHSTTHAASEKKKENEEQQITVNKNETEVNSAVQAKNETIWKYDEETKSTAQVIQGVLKETGTPQEVSPSDRKQLFGDPRMDVLTSKEIEEQTENIKKYMNETKHEEMSSKVEVNSEAIIPVKESLAPKSEPLHSEEESKKQKIVSDTSQQHTDKKGMQQPMGLKSLKEGAKTVKTIVSSLVADKLKDSTNVKKEVFNNSSAEQQSNLKENVQKTSVTQFLYNKKYKNAEKPANNEIQDLDPSIKDFPEKASLLHSKQAHNISAGDKSNDETKGVKPREFFKKKENGKADRKPDNLTEYSKMEEMSHAKKSSVQEDTTVKYVVSEGKSNNEVHRKAVERNIKMKGNNQGKPNNKISNIKRIYRDEASFEKEQQGKMTDDNVAAIEKYLQQEISKVSPEKVGGSMRNPKEDRNSATGENPKISAKPEADVKTVLNKHSKEQKIDKLKKIRPNKNDNMQPNANPNTTDVPTKIQGLKQAKDAISKPIEEGTVKEQQKKPHQEGTSPKKTSSSGAAKPDRHSSFDKYFKGNSESNGHSSFSQFSTGKNERDMHSSFDKYSNGKNDLDMHSSFQKHSTKKTEPDMQSSFDKSSAGKNERTEETSHDKHNMYFEAKNAKTIHPKNSAHTNITELVSHYSITDTNDTKLGHHKFQNIQQKNESINQSSKTVSPSQSANLPEASARQDITSQSITLLDSPPRYMMKDLKESKATNPAGDGLHPGTTQNTAWPVHELSTVNKKYLGKPMRPSSWGDAGAFLPWVPYVTQKKNNQNNFVTEKSEGHYNYRVNEYGSGNLFSQFLGQKYRVFKDNFNNHTNRGRANVAKATLLAVGLFAMWQMLKPKRHELMPAYQRCSECGSITPVEKKH